MGKYAAFISYRHEAADLSQANWLVEALDSFRTRTELVRSGSASHRRGLP